MKKKGVEITLSFILLHLILLELNQGSIKKDTIQKVFFEGEERFGGRKRVSIVCHIAHFNFFTSNLSCVN